ncbi:MAG: hypothetical protein U1G07_26280 [Verrucomicrobiota bacterium]
MKMPVLLLGLPIACSAFGAATANGQIGPVFETGGPHPTRLIVKLKNAAMATTPATEALLVEQGDHQT